jgi:hypothetical protein
LTLRPSPSLRLKLDVYASSTRVMHAVTSGTVSRSSTICGARGYRIRVSAAGGTGTFGLTVTKP